MRRGCKFERSSVLTRGNDVIGQIRFWLAAIFVSLLGFSTANAQSAKLTIGTEGDYPPWEFFDAQGKLTGFDIDLAQLLCKKMNRECELVPGEYSAMIPGLTAGKFDAVISAMNITAKRRQSIDFSIPYVVDTFTFLVPKNGPLAALPNKGKLYTLSGNMNEADAAMSALKPSLKGKVFGAVSATSTGAFLEMYFSDTITTKKYQTDQQRDLDLKTNRIDGIFDDSVMIHRFLKTPDGQDMTTAGPLFTGGVIGEGVAVGMRKDSGPLKEAFDAAIKSALADGSIRALSMKWFEIDISPR
jgi:octopine/nopaline transport system substrate-binding protein